MRNKIPIFGNQKQDLEFFIHKNNFLSFKKLLEVFFQTLANKQSWKTKKIYTLNGRELTLKKQSL